MNKLIFAMSVVGVTAVSAYGQIAAMDFISNDTNPASITSTRGYSFNVVDPNGIMVTQLSFFDAGSDGLADRHDVGIWDSAGTLLTSVSIGSGTSDPLDSTGKFRFKTVTPIFLAAGNDYVVAGTFVANTDLQAINMVGLSMGGALTYGQTRFNNNGINSLTFPTNTIAQLGLPGGSFSYEAVPEPMTLSVLGFGVAALLRRRKR